MLRLSLVAFSLVGMMVAVLAAQELQPGAEKGPEISGPGKETTGKSPVKTPQGDGMPGDCEIHFLNGSKVRLHIQTEKLDIATIYGNLSVPIEDVLAIDFGLHFPDGHEAKIDAAVKGLASTDFRTRATADKTLVDLGPYSYPAALMATRSKDAEVAGRAKEIVKNLQAKHPKKDLRTSPDDKVVTPTQTIVGRISTPTVKTKAEYFGVVEHKLAHMRTLRSLVGGSLEVDVVIDAGKFGAPGQWLETTYKCDGRSAMVIAARGQIDLMPNQGGQFAGPNGMPGRMMMIKGQRLNGPINPQVHMGWLIGKIGEDGDPFLIGDRYEGNPEREGLLFLHIGPGPWGQSMGSYDVKIQRKND